METLPIIIVMDVLSMSNKEIENTNLCLYAILMVTLDNFVITKNLKKSKPFQNLKLIQELLLVSELTKILNI